MGTRRLIKFGRNSYVVSLPKEWVVQQQLEKGSELHVEEKPNSLIITTAATTQQELTSRIVADGKSHTLLETEVMGAYKAGATTILITGKELTKKVSELKKLINYLAGAEVIEQDLHKLVIKDLIDVRQVALPSLLNRMDMMIRSMFQDILNEESIPASVLRERDRDVNRLQMLIARVSRTVLENPTVGALLRLTPSDAFYQERIAWTLERIGDYLKRLEDDLLRGKAATRKRLKAHLTQAYEYYLATLRAYYQSEKEKALITHDEIRAKLGTFTKQVYSCENRDEVLALENIKNIVRDLRIILRITVEEAIRAETLKSEGQET